jgi:hypothetical protein
MSATGTVTGVGYNPFRQRVAHRGDALIVIGALVVVAVLVLWALGAF